MADDSEVVRVEALRPAHSGPVAGEAPFDNPSPCQGRKSRGIETLVIAEIGGVGDERPRLVPVARNGLLPRVGIRTTRIGWPKE